MGNAKKYIPILRWAVFILVIALFCLLKSKGIIVYTQAGAKLFTVLLWLACAYMVIITLLSKTLSQDNLFLFYTLFADFLFASYLLFLTGAQNSPFIFLYYLIIIAVVSLEVKLSYKILFLIFMPVMYIIITGKAFLNDTGSFIEDFGAICIIGLAALLLTEHVEKEKVIKAHLIKLEEAYKVSRTQTKEKEEKELVLIDKSQKLLSLIEITRSMGATNRLDELLELIVNKARETLNTKLSFMMLIREKELRIAYSVGISETTKTIFKCRLGEGILGEAAVKNTIINLNIKDNPDRISVFANTFERIKNMLCIPLISPQDKKLIGMLGVGNLLIGEQFTDEHTGYLYTLATDASIFVRNKILFEELEKSYIEMVQALAQAVEARDPYTFGHIDRVKEFSMLLASSLGASPSEIDLIKNAAILHDLGKIGTPDSILLKPSALTDEERAIMNQHVIKSADILRDISSLNPKVLEIVRHHHERYDGTGYPDKLKGDQIPIEAQIISIADTFDAMTSDRPYRKGFPPEKAIILLKEVAGSQFSPKIVDAFVKLYASGKLNKPR